MKNKKKGESKKLVKHNTRRGSKGRGSNLGHVTQWGCCLTSELERKGRKKVRGNKGKMKSTKGKGKKKDN